MAQVTPAEMATLDPYYDNVVLQLSGDELACGRQHYQKPITAYGNAQISTAQSKFGGSSIYLDGTSYVTAPSDITFNLTNNHFCYEICVYPTNASAGNNFGGTLFQNILGQNQFGSATNASVCFNLCGMKPQTLVFNTTGYFGLTTSASSIPINTWSHIAYVRTGSTFYLFVNGTNVATATSTESVNSSTRVMPIGADSTGNCKYQGYLDELRITNGLARYTSNFTPPTEEFPWLEQIKYGNHGFTSALGIRAMAPPEALDSLGIRKISREHPRHNRDIYYGGNGMITGTVENTPHTHVYRRVQLIHDATKSIIRETWSDPVTGEYTFTNIDRNATYTVLSYDHTGNYRAVIADKQTPT
jgi:hypothetical protein